MSTDIQHAAWSADLHPPARLWVLMVVLPLVAILTFLTYQRFQVLPRIGLAPGYLLIDQNGNRLTNETLRGSVTLYNFTQTRCTGKCPQTSGTLQAMQHLLVTNNPDSKLDDSANDVPLHFVTIAYNPTVDTPDALRLYAEELKVTNERWHFATGDAAQLKSIIDMGFQAEYTQHADGTLFVEPLFVLVDGWGIVRALYPTATPDIDAIQRDIQLVLNEARNSTGVNRYAYEAVHLFVCHLP
jgi:protein SCO1/2